MNGAKEEGRTKKEYLSTQTKYEEAMMNAVTA
jgi:hypothetical protein